MLEYLAGHTQKGGRGGQLLPPPRHETFDPTVDACNVQFVLVTYVTGFGKTLHKAGEHVLVLIKINISINM